MNEFMRVVRFVDLVLVKIESVLIVVCLSSIILLGFTQVVLRNIFATGLIWADILSRHIVLWIGFTGAAIAASEGRHIHMDVLMRFLPDYVKKALSILTNAFAAVVCVVLCNAGWTFLRNEQSIRGEFVFFVPSWVPMVIIPVGFGLISFHFAIRMVESIVNLMRRPS